MKNLILYAVTNPVSKSPDAEARYFARTIDVITAMMTDSCGHANSPDDSSRDGDRLITEHVSRRQYSDANHGVHAILVNSLPKTRQEMASALIRATFENLILVGADDSAGGKVDSVQGPMNVANADETLGKQAIAKGIGNRAADDGGMSGD